MSFSPEDLDGLLPIATVAELRALEERNMPNTVVVFAPAPVRVAGGGTAIAWRSLGTLPGRARAVGAERASPDDVQVSRWTVCVPAASAIAITDDCALLVEGETAGRSWREPMLVTSVSPQSAHRVVTRMHTTNAGAPRLAELVP